MGPNEERCLPETTAKLHCRASNIGHWQIPLASLLLQVPRYLVMIWMDQGLKPLSPPQSRPSIKRGLSGGASLLLNPPTLTWSALLQTTDPSLPSSLLLCNDHNNTSPSTIFFSHCVCFSPSCLLCRFSGSISSTTQPGSQTTTSSRLLSSAWNSLRRVRNSHPAPNLAASDNCPLQISSGS